MAESVKIFKSAVLAKPLPRLEDLLSFHPVPLKPIFSLNAEKTPKTEEEMEKITIKAEKERKETPKSEKEAEKTLENAPENANPNKPKRTPKIKKNQKISSTTKKSRSSSPYTPHSEKRALRMRSREKSPRSAGFCGSASQQTMKSPKGGAAVERKAADRAEMAFMAELETKFGGPAAPELFGGDAKSSSEEIIELLSVSGDDCGGGASAAELSSERDSRGD